MIERERGVAMQESPLQDLGSSRVDRRLAHGIAWTGGVRWAAQVLSWASTIVVARLLSPADYGLYGMATLFVGLMAILSEAGLSSVILKHREVSTEEIASLFGFALMASGVAVAMTWAIAPLAAAFFHSPGLSGVLRALSVVLPIGAAGAVPSALLRRSFDFRALALVEGLKATVVSGLSIVLALAGLGYWTLVAGAVAGSLLSSTLLLIRCPHRVAWPVRRGLEHLLRFGGSVVVTRLAWYTYTDADFLVAGRVLGQSALGAYSFAWNLASLPVEKVSAMVGEVTPSFFAEAQYDLVALRRYLLFVTEGLSLATFPVAVGLALVSSDLVHVVFSDRWAGAAAPLAILACYACYRSIVTLLPQVASMTGLQDYAMRTSLLALFVMPVSFIIGAQWGAAGIAYGWVIAYPIVTVPLYRRVLNRVQLPFAAYFSTLWPALSSCTMMALAVLASRAALVGRLPPAAQLVAQVAIGAAVYAGTLMLWHGARLRRLVALARGVA